jgi:thymidylate synthase (FAD)
VDTQKKVLRNFLTEHVHKQTVELIKHNASDLDVARAAWVSNYGEDAREKDGQRVKGLINYLYREKHMSPFEHGSFTFFVDTTIFVAREFMRHRTGSYNETSGRYMELPPRFYVPSPERPLIQQGKVGNYTFVPGSEEQYEMVVNEFADAYEEDWARYQRLLAAGIAKEVARDILPVGIFTQFYVTMNPRNVMQFLNLRTAPNALYEIREVADQIEAIFAEAMPYTFDAYVQESYAENIAVAEARRKEEETIPQYIVNLAVQNGLSADEIGKQVGLVLNNLQERYKVKRAYSD